MLCFRISDDKEALLRDWQANHPCEYRRADFRGARYVGAMGGADTFCFTPLSSGGVITIVRCACGAELDLTDSLLD